MCSPLRKNFSRGHMHCSTSNKYIVRMTYIMKQFNVPFREFPFPIRNCALVLDY